MDFNRREVLQAAAGMLLGSGLLVASSDSKAASSRYSLQLKSDAWEYDSTNDVYYQLGCHYAAESAAPAYENLGIYAPGKFFNATKNSSGRYTVTINRSRKVGSYTALTAPIVLPVNTPGYAAQQPPTSYSYSDVASYLEAGFIYVAAGLRGRDSETSTFFGNAPWGVTDLKAAIRYIRYNAARVPGDTDRIFVFGMSGGGAQSAVAGASGDSSLYAPYLKSIGAALRDSRGHAISDAVAGAMCWCPITSLDWSNGAYEWNMGQFATTGTRASGTWTNAYSNDLAVAFAGYTNQLGLKDATGRKLSLERSSSGHYLAGTYYDHLLEVVSTSLNHFLSYTTFPYTYPGTGGPAGGGASSGGAPGGSGSPPSGAAPGGSGTNSTSSSSKTFKTVKEYIAYLNSSRHWVDYDAAKKTAKVTNLRGFIDSQKPATKDVGAFDGIARGETENLVFGHGTSPLHFAPESYSVIAAHQSRYRKFKDWESAYAASAYRSDFAKRDTIGKDQAYRANMYNPMYFLAKYYSGYGSSVVARNWRIRTGIAQGDTANTVEINLALALQNLGKKVDFETVWAEGHTMAEEANGNPETNFIGWVKRAVR